MDRSTNSVLSSEKVVISETKTKHYPFAVWLIFAGLVYTGSALLFGIERDLVTRLAFDIFFVPLVGIFCVLCYLSAISTLSRRRVAFVLSLIVSLIFIIPSLAVIVPTASNPSDFVTFVIGVSSVSILTLVAIFSALCLKNARRGLYSKRYLSTPISYGGLLALAVVALLIGAVTFGALQGGVAYSQVGKTSSVTIVLGASNPSNEQGHFTPSIITVVIGVNNTVTWINQDYSVHTITSDQGNFNSGLLNSGDHWSYTFTTPGIYGYHCLIHPYMTGTVRVLGSA